MTKLSIILPCYNEQENLNIICDEISKLKINVDFEILFIDDGSTDDTIKTLREISKQNKNVNFISFSRNFGKESAILAGIRNATGDYIAIMDCDMQDPPSLIPKMLELCVNQNYDIVRTYRTDRAGEPPIRSFFANKFYSLINKFSFRPILGGTRDFCLINKKVANEYKNIKERNRFFKETISWLGFKVYWLPYKNIKRTVGYSKWNLFKLFIYALDSFFNFSQIPFILSSAAIVTSFFFIILMFIFILKGYLSSGTNNNIMIYLLFFMCTLNFLYIGILGLYIGKVFMEVKSRPHYIIQESSITQN